MKMTKITTDTSTIAIFDLSALEHMIYADGDWWTYNQSEQLQNEINAGNVYLINTGRDGSFHVSVDEEPTSGNATTLRCPSNEIFIVCGEELPAEGLVPELLRGGMKYRVNCLSVLVSHTQSDSTIVIHIRANKEDAPGLKIAR